MNDKSDLKTDNGRGLSFNAHSWSLSMYSYELQDSSTDAPDPPDPNPPEDTGDGLPDVPDPCAELEPDDCANLGIGEAVEARGGWPPLPLRRAAAEPPLRLPLLLLPWCFGAASSSSLGLRGGSSSAAAASKKAAAWGCWWRTAVACAVRPYRSRLHSLTDASRGITGGS